MQENLVQADRLWCMGGLILVMILPAALFCFSPEDLSFEVRK